MGDEVASRVWGYLLSRWELLADEMRVHPAGRSLRTPSLPNIWDLNLLVVERGAPEDGIDAAMLAGEAVELAREGGGGHGRVSILDDEIGRRVAPDFRSFGWTANRLAAMVHRGEVPPPGDEPVGEPAEDDRKTLHAEIHRTHDYVPANDEAVVAELLAFEERCRARLAGRTFAAPPRRPVASAELYSLDGVAEIDAVETLPGHRARGLGRAVLLAALAASARRDEVTFVRADSDDWPAGWYARLGFETVAHLWDFDAPR